MASKTLFASLFGRQPKNTDTVNEAGGKAYAFTPAHALAQYAITGCMNGTYYASAETQLEKVLELCSQVEAAQVAKIAVYSRERGFMKDVPAVLLAHLATRDGALFERAFPRVVDNGKMLRNFVQIVRSGVVGRRSLGSRPKRLVQKWIESRTDDALFADSVGQSPSLADVVKMVHPAPQSESRRALLGYLLGREVDSAALPARVQAWEAFKGGNRGVVPDVPFQMLTSLELGQRDWCAIARRAKWQMTRMNLSTFVRHGVFEDAELTKMIAARLRNADDVRRARAFPYQLMATWASIDARVPAIVKDALHDAMEVSIANVPEVHGQVYVCLDVSGSMGSPATGWRKGATTAIRCIDVAALVAAAIVRKNRSAEVIPFDHDVRQIKIEPRDSVLTNARRLAAHPGGGTACAAPLKWLNKRQAKGDLVVYVSDNESWVDRRAGRGTATLVEWQAFKSRNRQARLVCIDIQPYGSTQVSDDSDVLNVGGFSDAVFDVVATFARGELGAGHWLGVIEQVQL